MLISLREMPIKYKSKLMLKTDIPQNKKEYYEYQLKDIHNIYSHLKTLDSALWKNRELEILFTAINYAEKDDREELKYYLLPGVVDGMEGYTHIYKDYSIPPNIGIINGIIFSDIVPENIVIQASDFDGVFKTTSFIVRQEDLIEYNYNGKMYKIWKPWRFMINSCYQESGIQFLRFDKDVDINTIGFVLCLKLNREMK
jgi:hypothetical protein